MAAVAASLFHLSVLFFQTVSVIHVHTTEDAFREAAAFTPLTLYRLAQHDRAALAYSGSPEFANLDRARGDRFPLLPKVDMKSSFRHASEGWNTQW